MSDLDARYGRTPRAARRSNWVWIVVTSVLLAGVVGFWALSQTTTTVESQIGGFTMESAHSVTVTASVSVHPGTPVACAFSAQSESDSVVGYRVVELEPSDEQNRTVTATLRTTMPANVVVVRECWVTETAE